MGLDDGQSRAAFQSSPVEPAARGAGGGGWEGYGRGQHQGSVDFGTAGEGDVSAVATAEAADEETRGKHEEEMAQALEETRKELEVARKAERDLR